MTEAELTVLITAFRKETEDLVMANVKTIFNIQYDEESLIEGTISVAIPDAYVSVDDYEVVVFSALDAEDNDIKDTLVIEKVTASSFTVESPIAGTLRWETMRRVPQINYWT
jgi:hypothetical protein